VADLGCGIGGDTLALARAGLTVIAVENDPLRLAMARANAAARGVAERIRFQEGDALSAPVADARAAFADPSRRSGDRRHLDPEAYSPALSALRARFPADFPLAVKLAPGVPARSVEPVEAEIEFVSVLGELKECVAWFGPLRTATRRASVLPAGATFVSSRPALEQSLSDAGAFVYDPDPAVVRAGLAMPLAGELGLRPLDHLVALFSSDRLVPSPFLRAFRVEAADRFHPGRLRDHLRERSVGRVTFIKRGTAIDTEALSKKLKLAGEGHRVVLLARLAGEERMLIAERA
jgi:SAM-dependent methyltransferase